MPNEDNLFGMRLLVLTAFSVHISASLMGAMFLNEHRWMSDGDSMSAATYARRMLGLTNLCKEILMWIDTSYAIASTSLFGVVVLRRSTSELEDSCCSPPLLTFNIKKCQAQSCASRGTTCNAAAERRSSWVTDRWGRGSGDLLISTTIGAVIRP
ncbi:uncharacterized protein EI90DRAFT_3045658 [Cantharellus anzutake]|uniref:uncharacterized protein n=1 Tax=Cantharellus anzutake TaxID=1750568 RepID=UPI001903B9F4|nr:uncharacterized protein EI90DRAFT_3045658 [Cantharellus anzutake]KAF8336410.1 hypothetical protein EI90DRAFT_3045658 [Cantharellus anzutake]